MHTYAKFDQNVPCGSRVMSILQDRQTAEHYVLVKKYEKKLRTLIYSRVCLVLGYGVSWTYFNLFSQHRTSYCIRMIIVSIQRDFATENTIFFQIKIIFNVIYKFAPKDLLTISASDSVHHFQGHLLEGYHIDQYDNYTLHRLLFLPQVMPYFNFTGS